MRFCRITPMLGAALVRFAIYDSREAFLTLNGHVGLLITVTFALARPSITRSK